MFSILVGLCAASAVQADLRDDVAHATRGFRDITVSCKVSYTNTAELKKIGKDFPKSFEFKNTTARYKVPHKMRVEGKLGLIKVALIMNGDYKSIQIPSLRIKKKQNIKDKPHERQTDFDLGLITESFWQDYVIQDTAKEKGPEGTAYKVTFIRENGPDRKHICWIDGDTYKLLKLEKYGSDGSLECKYVFSKHTSAGGVIWVPGRVDVYNPEGKLGATTLYDNIKANSDLPDSLFKI